MTQSEAQKWAESMVLLDCTWAYSAGWVMTYDSKLRYLMLAKLDSEKLNGVWENA